MGLSHHISIRVVHADWLRTQYRIPLPMCRIICWAVPASFYIHAKSAMRSLRIHVYHGGKAPRQHDPILRSATKSNSTEVAGLR